MSWNMRRSYGTIEMILILVGTTLCRSLSANFVYRETSRACSASTTVFEMNTGHLLCEKHVGVDEILGRTQWPTERLPAQTCDIHGCFLAIEIIRRGGRDRTCHKMKVSVGLNMDAKEVAFP